MRLWLTITLVVCLALGALPHAFCSCGCAEESRPAASPACQACGEGHAQPVPDKPEPCQCRTCEVVKAVAAGSQMPVPASDLTSRVPPTAAAQSVQSASADFPGDFSPAEPPGRSVRLGCALTVFLGHLLL